MTNVTMPDLLEMCAKALRLELTRIQITASSPGVLKKGAREVVVLTRPRVYGEVCAHTSCGTAAVVYVKVADILRWIAAQVEKAQ